MDSFIFMLDSIRRYTVHLTNVIINIQYSTKKGRSQICMYISHIHVLIRHLSLQTLKYCSKIPLKRKLKQSLSHKEPYPHQQVDCQTLLCTPSPLQLFFLRPWICFNLHAFPPLPIVSTKAGNCRPFVVDITADFAASCL